MINHSGPVIFLPPTGNDNRECCELLPGGFCGGSRAGDIRVSEWQLAAWERTGFNILPFLLISVINPLCPCTSVPFHFQLVRCTTWKRCRRTFRMALPLTFCLCWPKRSRTKEAHRAQTTRHPSKSPHNIGLVMYFMSCNIARFCKFILTNICMLYGQAHLPSLSVSPFSPLETLWGETAPGRPWGNRRPDWWGSASCTLCSENNCSHLWGCVK